MAQVLVPICVALRVYDRRLQSFGEHGSRIFFVSEQTLEAFIHDNKAGLGYTDPALLDIASYLHSLLASRGRECVRCGKQAELEGAHVTGDVDLFLVRQIFLGLAGQDALDEALGDVVQLHSSGTLKVLASVLRCAACNLPCTKFAPLVQNIALSKECKGITLFFHVLCEPDAKPECRAASRQIAERDVQAASGDGVILRRSKSWVR
ncbi:hypothetical protein DFJ74DRAFT_700725 [Hyaloraphidium curvatum]|nr:hypothetical protein DFJ74DRAFT_700725 [Hyaloraphidium curvatum]